MLPSGQTGATDKCADTYFLCFVISFSVTFRTNSLPFFRNANKPLFDERVQFARELLKTWTLREGRSRLSRRFFLFAFFCRWRLGESVSNETWKKKNRCILFSHNYCWHSSPSLNNTHTHTHTHTRKLSVCLSVCLSATHTLQHMYNPTPHSVTPCDTKFVTCHGVTVTRRNRVHVTGNPDV